MTLTKLMTLALARTGLSTTASAFVDRARDYANEGLQDLAGRRDWRWLYKTGTITTTASTRGYSLASDVMRPISFVHTTDDVNMEMIGAEEMDRFDPDADETGPSRYVFVKGINSSTGYWDVDLYPTPDTSSETVTYRYRAFIADKTSGDDSTDLAATLPPWAQHALVDYVTARYKGEKGDSDGEEDEMNAYLFKLQNNIRLDGGVSGNEQFRFPRRDSGLTVGVFSIQDGSLS